MTTTKLYLDQSKMRKRRLAAGLSGDATRQRLTNPSTGKMPGLSTFFSYEVGEQPVPAGILKQLCRVFRCQRRSLLKR